jgi:hypothetical protein
MGDCSYCMSICICTTNYFLVVCDILIDYDVHLMTDFVNLKIKLIQYFRGAHSIRSMRTCVLRDKRV